MERNDEFLAANERGRRLRRKTPPALAARYDRRSGRVIVGLSSGLDIVFSPRDVEGLENATPSQLDLIEITPSGLGLYFPRVDADVYLPGLLEGVLGSKKWMAARMGAAGGKSTSAAKRRAAKANGRLGGRPSKTAAS